MIKREANFSEDRKYRYTLSRIWLPEKPYVCFVGLNPSTADENIDDPTIRRCLGYANAWGYGGLVMVNLFAFRATDPKDIMKAGDPIGPDNEWFLKRTSCDAGLTIIAWGTKGSYLNQDKDVLTFVLTDPYYLKLTKEGYPAHPLYLKKDLKPKKYALHDQPE